MSEKVPAGYKRFKTEVERKTFQTVYVYAENMEDAVEIVQDAANNGDLEEPVGGEYEAFMFDGGYKENEKVKIIVGQEYADAIHVYPCPLEPGEGDFDEPKPEPECR